MKQCVARVYLHLIPHRSLGTVVSPSLLLQNPTHPIDEPVSTLVDAIQLTSSMPTIGWPQRRADKRVDRDYRSIIGTEIPPHPVLRVEPMCNNDGAG